ncbi:MAG: hypothetical protein ACK5Z4_15745, partial [Planctomyces sp.]
MFTALTDARAVLARWMVASRMLMVLSALALIMPMFALTPAAGPTVMGGNGGAGAGGAGGIGGPVAIPAARYARNIVVVTLEGEIAATTARSIKRRLDAAV